MKSIRIFLLISLVPFSHLNAQTQGERKVVITGARFTYPILEKWIAAYRDANPSVSVVIEPRTTADPSEYDLLIEAYEPDKPINDDREYLYLARYALIPVANSKSGFAAIYGEKGLTSDLIRQVFFNNIYADKEKQEKISIPYTIYTRLQKAGAPTTFARYFGFEQQNIKGKAIAGSDEHLVKAVLRDTAGVSYNNPGLIYDLASRKVVEGLTVLPVDADNNGRISNDEKFYDNLDQVLEHLENEKVQNIPVEYFHLSIRKHGYNTEALKFLLWVIGHSQDDLHTFGFLKPEPKRFEAEREKFEQLALK